MKVFDSSALLCMLQGEPGAEMVRSALDDGVHACSAANWSEVAQKSLRAGRDWTAARQLLLMGFDLQIEPVTAADAERAAALWPSSPTLSLGDRLCLATADRLDAEVWTCDTAWGTSGRVHQVR
ncbi:PIN domain-containing protein [Klenkia sp. LSe6-5]|uniref:PIN domain-containing protein n=1 Tax=Klenkia sesuvii TaxID=3103137 RepID=A0ABU8DXZ4_9ACTN